eukprot:2493488-Pyramimonas_sp.AAC.1
MARSFFRSHPQHFSTGFKSGLRAGTCQRMTSARSCACWQAVLVTKCSRSHSTCHGPLLSTGPRASIALAES